MDCDHPLDKQLSSASVEAAINLLRFAISIQPLLVAETILVIPLLAHVSYLAILCYSSYSNFISNIRLIIFVQPSAPLAKDGKSDEELAAHCLTIPGSHLNLSVLLDKKFQTYGHKPGALRGFNVLKEDELGTLEVVVQTR